MGSGESFGRNIRWLITNSTRVACRPLPSSSSHYVSNERKTLLSKSYPDPLSSELPATTAPNHTHNPPVVYYLQRSYHAVSFKSDPTKKDLQNQLYAPQHTLQLWLKSAKCRTQAIKIRNCWISQIPTRKLWVRLNRIFDRQVWVQWQVSWELI